MINWTSADIASGPFGASAWSVGMAADFKRFTDRWGLLISFNVLLRGKWMLDAEHKWLMSGDSQTDGKCCGREHNYPQHTQNNRRLAKWLTDLWNGHLNLDENWTFDGENATHLTSADFLVPERADNAVQVWAYAAFLRISTWEQTKWVSLRYLLC